MRIYFNLTAVVKIYVVKSGIVRETEITLCLFLCCLHFQVKRDLIDIQLSRKWRKKLKDVCEVCALIYFLL